MSQAGSVRETSPVLVEALLEVTSAEPGRSRIEAAVRGLSNTLGVMCAFAAEVDPEDPRVGRTLAICQCGEFDENFEYALAGTPCEDVYSHGICSIPSGVQQAYPEDAWLAEVHAESYFGIKFTNAAGAAIGHLGVAHDAKLAEGMQSEALFRLFAALVGAELASRDAESQRLANERRMLEGHRLESLGLLAGGVAHDFNNLLMGITGNTSLAIGETPVGSPVRRCLEEIETTAQRAAELARQMLAYSGKGRFVVADVDLNDVVEEMAQLLTVSIAHSARVRFDLALNLPRVRVDTTQIRQLVMNLVLNAAEAIEAPSGSITISTGVAHVDRGALECVTIGKACAPGDYVVLEVSDSGRGIPPELISRIFDPFFTQKPKGRGLGLAAVQGIVSGHRGILRVDSEPNRGTTFKLMLPPTAASPVSSLTRPALAPSLNRLRVLVIDDDPTVRSVTGRMLERLGCVVTQGEDGARGLEIYRNRQEDIDLVLLDMSMPGMNGHEVFLQIQAIDSDARVLLMSGYDPEESQLRFAGQGLGGFLSKPFDAAALARAIEAATAQQDDVALDRPAPSLVR